MGSPLFDLPLHLARSRAHGPGVPRDPVAVNACGWILAQPDWPGVGRVPTKRSDRQAVQILLLPVCKTRGCGRIVTQFAQRTWPSGLAPGSDPDVPEIGQTEALLIGNHVRTLLIYIGQRPKL